MDTRGPRLVGFTYRRGALVAEVRRGCRDELKILYSGKTFDDGFWERLRSLGELNVFEASKLNPNMKDLVRLKLDGVRIEGARGGELVVVFYGPSQRSAFRKRLERLMAE